MVEIPQTLINKLAPLGPHFCLVEARGKSPDVGGKEWQKHPLNADDPKLLQWLEKGGNYGVICGYGLTIVETDIPELQEVAKAKLPETFTVLSPGHQGWHLYYVSSLDKPIRLRDEKGESVGEVQGPGKMVLGPGSVHPNGKVYKIVNDRPLAQVTREQLVEALKPWVIPDKEIDLAEALARQERKQSNIDLDILQVVPLAGLHKQGDEYYGSHPVHGSDTGHNFWVNPSKNCWHCFRHKTGGGPLLWLAVEEGIIRCEDAGPGVLRGEVFKRVFKVAIEKGYIKEPRRMEETEKPLALTHINLIEDPALACKPIIVEAVVSSTSISYLSPKKVEATVQDEEGNVSTACKEISDRNPVNIKIVGCNEETKYGRLKRFFAPNKVLALKEQGWRAIYLIRVRPPVFTLEKRGEKIVDEKGFEYKAFDIYVTSETPLIFQPSSLVRVEGLPIPNPRTQKTTLLAYKVEFPEETKFFNIDKLQLLKTQFQGKTVKERLDWVLDNFEVYSKIVKRRDLAMAAFLCFYTPTWVRFNHEVQRGWGSILSVGDTTTAKTETIRKMIQLFKAGMLVTAETASTVGLTGTATQIEREGWFVDWGFLVLLDRKLLAVDGAHKLSTANWAALAESDRSGVVSIAKAAKSTAYARTRQIKIANAVDREADKYTTKSLSSFLYPCQALPTILDKTSIARLDLAVFADLRDVSPQEINRENSNVYDENLELLSESLKWCWSDLAEVTFTDEAVKYLLEQATDLYNTFFCEMIPLASIDLKWKLARLSASLAYLTLSTEDFSTVTVTREHVETVVSFIREEYIKAGLNTLAQQAKFEALDLDDVKHIFEKIIADTKATIEEGVVKEVLRFIVTHGRLTKDELKTRFSLSENSQARPLLASLKSEGLVKASRGFYPEPKLIEAYKVSGGFTFAY
jgi:hypothetical protein